jgi:DNA-directed RNA polymerase specialized sigma24 family protein
MGSDTLDKEVEMVDLNIEGAWKKLSPLLKALARYCVFASRVPSWHGQEHDIIEDVVQETWRRIIERCQKVERGEALPIQSLKSMLMATVQNYCKDLRRHDCRLLRLQPQDVIFQAYLNRGDRSNLEEAGIEGVYQEALFRVLAQEVAAFPGKQRQALLIDLASRMHFGGLPSVLQQAFLDVGIDLQEYKQAVPSNAQERNRHIALVSCAYKRLAGLQKVQKYIALA